MEIFKAIEFLKEGKFISRPSFGNSYLCMDTKNEIYLVSISQPERPGSNEFFYPIDIQVYEATDDDLQAKDWYLHGYNHAIPSKIYFEIESSTGFVSDNKPLCYVCDLPLYEQDFHDLGNPGELRRINPYEK